MTNGDRMIWIAGLMLHLIKGGALKVAVEVAHDLVVTLRKMDVDGEAGAMLREMVGEGEASYCPQCGDFLAGGEHFEGRRCGMCHSFTVGKVRPTCHGTGQSDESEEP